MLSQTFQFPLFATIVLAAPMRRLDDRTGRIIQRDFPTISYHGGPLILKPEVHPIYDGDYPKDTTADVQQFYNFLTKSAVMDHLSNIDTFYIAFSFCPVAEYSVPGKKISYGTVAIPLNISTNLVDR
ncbi:hypothetical protein BC830DRAFT_538641 [Chytriomyces sp. MP71]|nr:hypothetical protein BC830DRAFT_538641 [Chytriomyces sp. MP71]